MLAFIWGQSLMTADSSTRESESVLSFVRPAVTAVIQCLQRLGIDADPAVLVRKLAHFTEFAVLGILMYLLFSTPERGSRGILPAAACLAAAGVDEFLQRFADGRAPALRDVGIDFAGACVGILLAARFLARLFRRRRRRYRRKLRRERRMLRRQQKTFGMRR